MTASSSTVRRFYPLIPDALVPFFAAPTPELSTETAPVRLVGMKNV